MAAWRQGFHDLVRNTSVVQKFMIVEGAVVLSNRIDVRTVY